MDEKAILKKQLQAEDAQQQSSMYPVLPSAEQPPAYSEFPQGPQTAPYPAHQPEASYPVQPAPVGVYPVQQTPVIVYPNQQPHVIYTQPAVCPMPQPSAPVLQENEVQAAPVVAKQTEHVEADEAQPFVEEKEAKVVIKAITLGKKPVECVCPKCNRAVKTRTRHTAGCCTWMLSLVGLCVCAGLCLCLVPFSDCMNGYKDVEHSCPDSKCGHRFGKWKKGCSP